MSKPKSVTIAGTTFPEDVRPGAGITFTNPWDADPFTRREGTVLDRAPQGQSKDQPSWSSSVSEGSGYWLWVIPSERREGEGHALRVRYYATGKQAGQAHVDRFPMVVRVGAGRYELRNVV